MPEYTKSFTAIRENLCLISLFSTWGSEKNDTLQMEGIQAGEPQQGLVEQSTAPDSVTAMTSQDARFLHRHSAWIVLSPSFALLLCLHHDKRVTVYGSNLQTDPRDASSSIQANSFSCQQGLRLELDSLLVNVFNYHSFLNNGALKSYR